MIRFAGRKMYTIFIFSLFVFIVSFDPVLVPKSLCKMENIQIFLFSGHEPIYFIENKEKTLRASYDRGTQVFDYMD